MTRRIVFVFSMLICMFTGLFFKLFSLSANNSFIQASSAQSTYSLDVYKNRAAIYDCNFNSLVNSEDVIYAAVVPDSGTFDILSGHVKSKIELVEYIEVGEPFVIEVDTEDIEYRGIKTFKGAKRYSDNQTAEHVIGYLDGDKNGTSGAELAFDEFLKEHSQTVNIRYQRNAIGQIMDSKDAFSSITEHRDSAGIVLTLDEKIQNIAKTAAEKLIDRGAVVIMDVENGDIKASVSLPGFSPNNISDALDDKDSPLYNRAFAPYNVGSTFKICTAAAALENGINPSEQYVCTGSIDVNGQIFHCHKRSGHGALDMKRATEVSCNPYFINLAMNMPNLDVVSMASRMGFGKENMLLGNCVSGSAGSLPGADDLQNSANLANFSFGQGKLLATPVQIAQMVSSVANGGKSVQARLAVGEASDKWEFSKEFEEYEPVRIMSEKTAEIICENMISTVENGSGQKAKPQHGSAGGKTASAQTGQYDENGKEKVQAWFAGFYPAKTPKYAIVVLNEDMESGGDYAAPVFKDICDGLYRLGFADEDN